MKVTDTQTTCFLIEGATRRPGLGVLDPIVVYLTEHDTSRATLTLQCYGRAWTCYWGSMGGTFAEFCRRVSAEYMADCLIRGRSGQLRVASERHEHPYLADICEAVRGAVAMRAGA